MSFHIERLPPEVMLSVLSQLDSKTLVFAVPQVCKQWRALCQNIRNVHLDFSWGRGVNVPVEVLAGWRQTPFILSAGGGVSTRVTRRSSAAADAARWRTGLCELFPRTTSVTMRKTQVEDAHLMALADKCPGITHANFNGCKNLTDAAVLALAAKCPGITHADFRRCGNLTDAAVLALADKCPGFTLVDFSGCENLTDAAVVALADKCPGIMHANFYDCENLTHAMWEAVQTQRPNCSFSGLF